MNTNILWLGTPQCDNPALVGGKTANLSRLAAREPVPPGFCLTTASYALAHGARRPRKAASTSAVALPAALRAELVLAYAQLAARSGQAAPPVAVRSSAVDEDGGAASFAGQHETYLNVAGADAVVDAVARCWESARSQRALAYRHHYGMDTQGAPVAVLVQQLVVADVSAVVFSSDPVTGARDRVVINASWGLGESVVGGTVTPDTYTVRKSDLAVVGRQIAEKRQMTVAVPGGTAEVTVPRFLRNQPALDGDQIDMLARLALELEMTMGWAVDLECAYQDGQLHLLQCRPITTLAQAA
jgi:phosphoenolpyruvate synthase/pyruvate phosphate dikinase